VDLARNLIRLSGFEPDVDIAIIYTGLRPGEKLHEQLTSAGEETMATRYEKIRVVKTEIPPLNERTLDALRDAVQGRDERTILRRMQELVPEFAPQAALLATIRDRVGTGDARATSLVS
jgi:FlaA1/EpsC-like NDP-sugar epimerase